MKTTELADSEDHITRAALEESSTKLIPSNSVLLVTRSGILSHTLPVARTLAPVAINQDLKAITPHKNVDVRFLTYALRSVGPKILDTCGKSGTTVASLNSSQVLDFCIPVPPLAEQRRIVTKLEDLLARARRARAALESIPPLLERFRQSVLTNAVFGQLIRRQANQSTRETKNEVWYTSLLKLAKSGRSRRNSGHRSALAQTLQASIEDSSETPAHWQSCPLETLLIEPMANGRSIRTDLDAQQSGLSLLRLDAMDDRGFQYSRAKQVDVSNASLLAGLEVHEGDFFVSRGNGSLTLVGRGTLAQEPPQICYFPDTMIRLRLEPTVRRWVSAIWPSPWIRRQIEARVKTTAGIWKISQEELRSIGVPLPPLAEQDALCTALEASMQCIAVVRADIDRSLADLAKLESAILSKAFRGELVPQDPSDEPASVLLERIRAEREASGGNGKKARGRGRGKTS